MRLRNNDAHLLPRRSAILLEIDGGERWNALVFHVPPLPQPRHCNAAALFLRVGSQANQASLGRIDLGTQFVVRRTQLEVRSRRTEPLRIVPNAGYPARSAAALLGYRCTA